MNAMLILGATKESVTAARGAIIDIIEVPNVDSEVKIKALDVLSTLCAVNNATVQNCNFTGQHKK